MEEIGSPYSVNTIHSPLRIALYSHDTCGLGHMRRNLLIAETLANHFPNINILLITGSREVAAFRYPPRVDAVTLPSLYKGSDKSYRPRAFDLDLEEFVDMRSQIIRTSIEKFNPDIFIVDKVPRGTMGELEETLCMLDEHTVCVLGLRDILDNPALVGNEWNEDGTSEAIELFYDAVWVYGDKTVYDARTAYNFSDAIADKTLFTGYLDPSSRLKLSAPQHLEETLLNDLGSRFFMCAVGGGQDGAKLAESFALASFPENVHGLIVKGPHMPADKARYLDELAQSRPHLKVVDFLPEPLHLYAAAEKVVTMGGYNTTMELIGIGAQVLIVPRVHPREEQFIRSRAFSSLGLVDCLHPDDLSSEHISAWLNGRKKFNSASSTIDMQGLQRIPEFARELLVSKGNRIQESQNSPEKLCL